MSTLLNRIFKEIEQGKLTEKEARLKLARANKYFKDFADIVKQFNSWISKRR